MSDEVRLFRRLSTGEIREFERQVVQVGSSLKVRYKAGPLLTLELKANYDDRFWRDKHDDPWDPIQPGSTQS